MKRWLKIFYFWLPCLFVAQSGSANTFPLITSFFSQAQTEFFLTENTSCSIEDQEKCKEQMNEELERIENDCSERMGKYLVDLKKSQLPLNKKVSFEHFFKSDLMKNYSDVFTKYTGPFFWNFINGVYNDDNYLQEKKYEQDCKLLVRSMYNDKDKGNEAISALKPEMLDGNIYRSTNKEYGRCLARTKSGNVLTLNACDETEGVIQDTDLMTLLSMMNYPLSDADFYKIGTDHYCTTCYEKKAEALELISKAPPAENPASIDSVEEELVDKLAQQRIESSFYKLSSYIEDVARVSNLNPNVEPNDLYCLEELEAALSSDCSKDRKKTFENIVKKLGFCSGEDCHKEYASSIFKKFKEKVESRAGEEPLECYNLEQTQLRYDTVKPIQQFSILSKLIFKDKDSTATFVEIKKEVEDENPEDPPYRIMGKTLKKMISDPQVRQKNMSLVYIVEALQKDDENRNHHASEWNKNKDPDVMALSRFFWKSFKELPELAAVFQHKETFKETFKAFMSQKEKKDFVGFINQNLIKKDEVVTMDRLKPYKEKACQKFKKDLEEGLCLNKENYKNGSFSPVDIANATKELAVIPRAGDDTITKEAARRNIYLASLSCSVRNRLQENEKQKLMPTVSSNPLDYMLFPNNFIYANGGEPFNKFDKIAQRGKKCAAHRKSSDYEETSLEERLNLLFVNTAESSESSTYKSFLRKTQTQTTDESIAREAEIDAQNSVEEMYAYDALSNESYMCYGGNCENTSLRDRVGEAARDAGRKESSGYDPHSGTSNSAVGGGGVYDGTDSTSSSDGQETPFVGEKSDNDKPEIINPFEGITGSGGNNSYLPQAPMTGYGSYINSGEKENNALSQKEMEERNEAIGNIAGKFPGAFSPEQLSALSSEELQKLLAYADEKASKEKQELEEEKLKLQKERAAFEKEKIQAEIKQLEEEKQRLLAETQSIKNNKENERAPSVLLGSQKDSTPNRYIVGDKPVVANTPSNMDNFNRQVMGGELSDENYSSGTSNQTTGHSNQAAMRGGGTTGATMALLREYKSSYYDGANSNVSQVVDNYLNYIQSNNVATSEIIRRNASGELIEILIPNDKGELVSLDISTLEAEERERLEKKIEELIALENKEKGQIRREIASVPDARILDIDEKISRLNNELQESYLDDLRQNIVEALLNSRE